MTTKEKTNSFAKGKLKQKLVLYMERHYAQNVGNSYGAKVLDDDSYTTLFDSFRTPDELYLFTKYNQLIEAITLLSKYLETLFFQFSGEMYQVNGYILLQDAYKREEQLLNSILHEISQTDNRRLKDRITSLILNSDRVMAQVQKIDNGFVSIYSGNGVSHDSQDRDGYNLDSLIQGWAGRGSHTLAKAKATILSVRQTIEEAELNLRPVKAALKFYEQRFSIDWAILSKYSRYTTADMGNTGKDFVSQKIYPTYNEIEPDPAEYQRCIDELKSVFNDQ